MHARMLDPPSLLPPWGPWRRNLDTGDPILMSPMHETCTHFPPQLMFGARIEEHLLVGWLFLAWAGLPVWSCSMSDSHPSDNSLWHSKHHQVHVQISSVGTVYEFLVGVPPRQWLFVMHASCDISFAFTDNADSLMIVSKNSVSRSITEIVTL